MSEQIKEAKEQLEEEYDIIVKRLEAKDQVFKFENHIFAKMAVVIQRANVPVLEAFNHFDKDGSGRLDQQEFSNALDMLGLKDLTIGEKKIVYGALDNDRDGGIDYNEFCGKLSRHGMRTRSKEEQVIY